MKRLHFLLSMAAAAVAFVPSFAWADAAVDPAVPKAAIAYLHLCDGGNYAAAWDQAADVVKSQIKKDIFVDQMKQARTPLGAVVKRSLSDTKTANLPGVGDSVVFIYATSFKTKDGVHETLVFSKASDGKWKASGYHIQ